MPPLDTRGAAHAERTPVEWGLITRYPAENEAYAPTRHPRADASYRLGSVKGNPGHPVNNRATE